MLGIYRKVFDFLEGRERRHFFLLMLLMIVMTFAEILGISTLLVLLNAFSKPEQMLDSDKLAWLFSTFGFQDIFRFQIFLSVLVFIVVMLGLVIKGGGNFAIIRFSSQLGSTLSVRLLAAYLFQPFVWSLERNSSDISKNVLAEVGQLTSRVVMPLLLVAANVMMTSAIVIFLIIVDPVVAVMSAVTIGGGYLAVYWTLRRKLVRAGKEMLSANQVRYRLTQESTAGFKEVKLLGLENSYVSRFDLASREFADTSAWIQVIGQIPRFALEALTFAVMLSVILILLVRNDGDLASSVPSLGIFGFSVMRLLPAIQNVYFSMSTIRSAKPVLETVHADYMASLNSSRERTVSAASDERLTLNEMLELRGVTFAYPTAGKPSLQGLDLKIQARTRVGIVGGTGAGKTTLVDLILGLLTPADGQLLVDGVALTSQNLHAWRKCLGYVPQTIYLTDSTIAENIAFGIPADKIDMAAVEKAARIASLHEFVANELSNGYQTIVGERGVRLSGGQRQRIGIARALYTDPELLILDEATSALDNLTERAIMDAVHNLGHDKTIIMIAHRLTTVRNCDRIVLLNHGEIQADGTFDGLIETSETFRDMAQAPKAK